MAGESFDQLKPGTHITDPDAVEAPRSGEYPRHMHKWAGPDRINDYIVVQNDKEKATALKKGYALQPLTEDPAAPVDKSASE